MTNRNVREGVRTFNGRNYRVKRIDSNGMFGYSMVRQGNFWVPVSDVEKTAIDIVRFYGHITEDEFTAILAVLDRKKLREYLNRFGTALDNKVLDELRMNDTQRGKTRRAQSVYQYK